MKYKKVLVTGSAGFIGYSLSKKLIENKIQTIGFDNLNNYYDVRLKKARINELEKISQNNKDLWKFFKSELQNKDILREIFCNYKPDIVVHLAAQAGVRYSITNPDSYIKSNIEGFQNIIECCREFKVNKFLYASSSSVYGGNKKIPFSEEDPVNHPISLYAATKRSNELVAHSYSHLFGIECIGLRFFSVYGPWGRPDMAPMIFTKAILSGESIKVFNRGEMFRDFTYIDDVVETVFRLIKKTSAQKIDFDVHNPSPGSSWAPSNIYNIGNGKPINLLNFIEILEKELNTKAEKEYQDLQPGDVKSTLADTLKIESFIDYKPNTNLEEGIKNLVSWYKSFYKSKK